MRLKTNADFHNSVLFLLSLPTFSLYLLRSRNTSSPNLQPSPMIAVSYYTESKVPILHHPSSRHFQTQYFATNSYQNGSPGQKLEKEVVFAKTSTHGSLRFNTEFIHPFHQSHSQPYQELQMQSSHNSNGTYTPSLNSPS